MADLLDLERRLQAAENRLAYFETLPKGYAYGTYTPTLTGVTNVAASTAYVTQYSRVGNMVTVFGRFNIDPTAAGLVQLGISLPIASNFANTQECGGVAFSGNVFGQGGTIEGDITNNRAQLFFQTTDTANRNYHFIFGYQII